MVAPESHAPISTVQPCRIRLSAAIRPFSGRLCRIGVNDLDVEAELLTREFGAEIDAAHAGLTGKRQHAAAGHDRSDFHFRVRRKRWP
jgi:hypothetical protein